LNNFIEFGKNYSKIKKKSVVQIMLNRDEELLKEAEELEYQSKIATRDKNYSSAIQALMKAKDIYTKIGLDGQVSIVIKEILRLKNLIPSGNVALIPTQETKHVIEEPTQFKAGLDKFKEQKTNDTSISEANGYQILEKARGLALKDKHDESIKQYNKAYSIFKHLNYDYECKQILWQLNEIRDYQRRTQLQKSTGVPLNLRDIVALASAEKRREKIQKGLGVKIPPQEFTESKPNKTGKPSITTHKLFQQMKVSEQKEEQLRNQTNSFTREQQEQQKIKIREKQEKLQILQEQRRKEEELVNKGQELLEMGNQKLKQKDYDTAKAFYSQAIQLFTQLGWHDQITILQKELHNIDVYKREEEIKLKQVTYTKVKKEQDFQKRVSDVLSEKQKVQVRQLERKQAITPEIKKTLDKVELIRVKADKEEYSNNIARALARYEYILSLYKSIPTEAINLSEEISKTEQKISELKGKV
jgi:tRNA U34 5-methylaminomethyl-2-thiouridine-forming methyltransferase MnmC